MHRIGQSNAHSRRRYSIRATQKILNAFLLWLLLPHVLRSFRAWWMTDWRILWAIFLFRDKVVAWHNTTPNNSTSNNNNIIRRLMSRRGPDTPWTRWAVAYIKSAAHSRECGRKFRNTFDARHITCWCVLQLRRCVFMVALRSLS